MRESVKSTKRVGERDSETKIKGKILIFALTKFSVFLHVFFLLRNFYSPSCVTFVSSIARICCQGNSLAKGAARKYIVCRCEKQKIQF